MQAKNDNFFRMMVESSSGYSVFTTDKKGNISTWNAGSQKTFGYKRNEVLGKNVSLIFTAKDIQESLPKKELEDAKGKGKFITERDHVKKNGSLFWASGLVYPLKDKEGTHRVLLLFWLTARKKKQLIKERMILSAQQPTNSRRPLPACGCSRKS